MLKWLRKQMQQMMQQEGLTLIELIVVVAIIAILAFAVTPRVLDALENSKRSSARSIATEFHSALERFYVNRGSAGTAAYPDGTGANFTYLTTILGNSLTLSSTNNNVFDATTVSYTGYTGAGAAIATPAAAAIPTHNHLAAWYCLRFDSQDRDTTTYQVTPAGVTENPAGTCPTGP